MIEAYGTYNERNKQWKYQFENRAELEDFLKYNDAVLFGVTYEDDDSRGATAPSTASAHPDSARNPEVEG